MKALPSLATLLECRVAVSSRCYTISTPRAKPPDMFTMSVADANVVPDYETGSPVLDVWPPDFYVRPFLGVEERGLSKGQRHLRAARRAPETRARRSRLYQGCRPAGELARTGFKGSAPAGTVRIGWIRPAPVSPMFSGPARPTIPARILRH